MLEIACDINRFDDALLLVLIEKFLGIKIEKYSTKREFNKRGSKDNKYNTELIKSNNKTVQILKFNLNAKTQLLTEGLTNFRQPT